MQQSDYKIGGVRKPGNMQTFSVGLTMTRALRAIANEPTTRVKVVKRGVGQGLKKNMLLTDDEVRTARRWYEQEGVSMQAIADHFKLKLAYVRALLDYQVRSKVI